VKAEATFSLTGKSYLYYDLGVNFFDTANVYSFGTSEETMDAYSIR